MARSKAFPEAFRASLLATELEARQIVEAKMSHDCIARAADYARIELHNLESAIARQSSVESMINFVHAFERARSYVMLMIDIPEKPDAPRRSMPMRQHMYQGRIRSY